jgi:hypothetical protein
VVITVEVLVVLVIILFVFVAGLLILWRKGAGDLDAWGVFVSRVIRGERSSMSRRSQALPLTSATPHPVPVPDPSNPE